MICILINLDANICHVTRSSHALNRVGSNVRAFSVWLDHVDKRRDPSKVDNQVIVVNGDGGNVFRSGCGEGCDIQQEFVSPDLHSITEQRVSLPIAQNSSAEGRSPFYLLRVPEVSSPCTSRGGTSGVSRGSSEMAGRVEEFYLFVGTDDQDSCWRQTFISNICTRPTWTLASPWVE